MIRSPNPTTSAAAVAIAFALLAAGCGGEGAGSSPGFTQVAPVDQGGPAQPATATLTVSQAQPAGGNGIVTVGTGTSALVQPGLRRVQLDGSAAGVRHRFVVDVDVASGAVLAASHLWADPTTGADVLVQCPSNVAVGGSVLPSCQFATADLSTNRVSFAGTRLRGPLGTQSVLSGAALPFVATP